ICAINERIASKAALYDCVDVPRIRNGDGQSPTGIEHRCAIFNEHSWCVEMLQDLTSNNDVEFFGQRRLGNVSKNNVVALRPQVSDLCFQNIHAEAACCMALQMTMQPPSGVRCISCVLNDADVEYRLAADEFAKI